MKGHIVAAALHHFGMDSVDDNLPPQIISDLKQSSTQNRQSCFNRIIHSMLNKFVYLPNNPGERTPVANQPDGIFSYAQEVLTYGLMYLEFEDSIKEGDGPRVIRCWKFFLPIFKSSNRTKYALEAVKLLINLQMLPERLQQQIIWSRFVNTSGKAAENKPCDLHMEHLNRTAKEELGQHSHLNPKSVNRIGNCVGLFQNVCKQFDIVTGAHQSSGKHVRASDETDLKKIVHQLHISKVFQTIPNRCHASFKMFDGRSLTERITPNKYEEWLNTHIHKLKANYAHINIQQY